MTPSAWVPPNVANALLRIIGITAVFSLFAAVVDGLLGYGMEGLFSLSPWGLSQGYFWQPVTYLFLEPGTTGGVTLGFLLGLGLNLGLVWILGTQLAATFGLFATIRLYFLASGIAALVALALTYSFSYYAYFSGPAPAVLAFLVVWTLLNPNQEILFFLFAVPAKWLTVGWLVAMTLMQISQGQWTALAYNFTGAVVGFFYGTALLEIATPFPWIDRFIEQVISYPGRLYRRLRLRKSKSQIIPFPGQEEDNEAFIDRMLAKISAEGEESLTPHERRRLDQLASEKKQPR